MWSQMMALSSLFKQRYFFLKFKGTPSFKFDKKNQEFNNDKT